MRVSQLWVVSALLLLAGCIGSGGVPGSRRAALGDSLHRQQILVVPAAPAIVAAGPAEVDAAAALAGRFGSDMLSQRDGARWLTADTLPMLAASPEGQRFLAATGARALAQGAPPAACPALAAAAPEGASPQDAVRAALKGCFAALGPGRPGCGCRIVAYDDMLAVPHDEVAYATGETARLSVPARGLDLVLVAEETDARTTLLRGLTGPVAWLEHGEGDRVTLRFADDGAVYEGRRIAVGFRRGRVAERVYATGPDGARLSLLIGFEPDELAQHAAAWLAWPAKG